MGIILKISKEVYLIIRKKVFELFDLIASVTGTENSITWLYGKVSWLQPTIFFIPK